VPVALALNSRAQACFPKDEVPQALRIQRRELLHNAGLDWSEPSDDGSGDDGPPRAALDRAFQALDCVARGDYRGGVELLRELRYSVPQDFTVQFLAGVCHESLHQFQQAETCFSACLSLRPDSARALYERGLCRFALRQFPEARRDFEEVLSLEPENRSALVSRALTLAAVENHADAVTELTKAIDRGFPETRVYFLRAGLLRKLGNDSGAERDRHEGLTRTPSDPRSWVSRGIANLPLNPHQALADFREAVRLNPREYEAHRNIAHVLAERLNQPAEALGVLNHLLEMTADDPLAWAGRGVLLARQGQVDGARRDAERALAIRRDAVVLYQAACIHALCGDWGELSSTDERLRLVLPLLSEALQIDPALTDVALTDSDLKSVQSARPFQQVVAAAQLLRLARDPGEIPSIGSGREGAAE
jgi:tetratricopeptide (TPR) repeat protein